jgi:hypothetical protein
MVASLDDADQSFMLRTQDAAATFEAVPPGRYVVSSLGTLRPPKTIEVVEGQKTRVALEPGPCKITGVVRSGGKPVGGGTVSCFVSPRVPRGVFQGNVPVGPDGRYTIDGLVADGYRVICERPGGLPHEVGLKVEQPQTTFDIDLPTGRIEGRLIGRTPKPKDPYGIGSIRVLPEGFPPKLGAGVGCFVEAEPDGRFTVEHVPPGRYTLTGYGLATTVTLGGEGSVVAAELRPPAQTGQIAGTLGGTFQRPSEGRRQTVYVTAFPRGDDGYNFHAWAYQATVEPDSGAYRITDVPAGTYGVVVTGSGPGPAIPCTWLPNVEVRAGLSRELSIAVPEGRAVWIVTEDRLSLERGAAVCTGWRLRVPSGDWLDRGLFGSPIALPLGEYTIEVAYAERGTVSRRFTVERGEGVMSIAVTPPAATDLKPTAR